MSVTETENAKSVLAEARLLDAQAESLARLQDDLRTGKERNQALLGVALGAVSTIAAIVTLLVVMNVFGV